MILIDSVKPLSATNLFNSEVTALYIIPRTPVLILNGHGQSVDFYLGSNAKGS